MASSTLLFLSINLMLFAIATSCNVGCNPTPKGSCPRDALKLGSCAKLLDKTIGTDIGNPPDHPCCSALGGLLDLEVAACLCTALKAKVLGINLDIPISLSLLVNTCGKSLPKDFTCA